MWLLLAVVGLRLLLAWRGWFVRWGAWLYLAAAVAAAATVGYNGYLGGKMVFDHGVGTAPVQRQAPPAVATAFGRGPRPVTFAGPERCAPSFSPCSASSRRRGLAPPRRRLWRGQVVGQRHAAAAVDGPQLRRAHASAQRRHGHLVGGGGRPPLVPLARPRRHGGGAGRRCGPASGARCARAKRSR